MNFNQFFTLQRELIDTVDARWRFVSDEIVWGDRCIGILWPRGIGKTTMLLQYLKTQESDRSLYVSLDHVYFYDQDLFAFVEWFVREYGGTCIILDEVQKYKNWSQVIKSLYDSFPKLQILFSGSSSTDLRGGTGDLSRRALIYTLSGCSFREFLFLEKKIALEKYTIEDIFEGKKSLPYDARMLEYYREYIEYGYYPYLYDVHPQTREMRVRETVDKTLYEDIAGFYAIQSSHVFLLKKLLTYIASIPPGSMSINKLAKTLEIDHKTVSRYLEILEKWGLIRYLKKDAHGYNLLKNTEKIYPDNPTCLLALSRDPTDSNLVGTIRELFALLHMDIGKYPIAYSSQGDMIIDGTYTIEVWGANKSMNQLQWIPKSFLLLDNMLLQTEKNIIPLWALGLMV